MFFSPLSLKRTNPAPSDVISIDALLAEAIDGDIAVGQITANFDFRIFRQFKRSTFIIMDERMYFDLLSVKEANQARVFNV